jgi:hypothetical protein
MVSAVFAQTVTVKTFGVDPRDVERADSVYFDRSYNGTQNVGIQTKVYLEGTSTLTLTSPTWSFVSTPEGSNAAFGTTKDVDTSNQIITFIPDLVGRYVIKFTDGSLEATVTVDAATYLGLGAAASCKNCHGPLPSDYPYIYDKWVNTGHANIFREAMEGTLSTHYGPACVGCHTTGNDPSANNNGFDDRDFVYPTGPDSLGPNTWEKLLTTSPEAMKLANIQCESCHGPGSEHVNNPYDTKEYMITLDVNNCAWCHDSGTHHAFPEQWKHSGDDASEFDGRGFEGGHAKGSFVQSAGTRSGCSPCHSGAGYVQWIKEGRPVDAIGLPAATAELPEATNISCAVCHDPHDATNLHQLRALETSLGDGTPITFEEYGTGAQCMDCHRSRREAKSYTEDVNNGSTHYGAHHGPQADMLLGKNAPDFGIELPSSPHGNQGNSCNDCHMAGALADANGNINVVGGHSWNMNDAEGKDFVEACVNCHGSTVGTSFKDKKYYINGNADLDGNGIAEGLQIEVEGLMEQLSAFLPHDADGNVLIHSSNVEGMTLTPEIMKAGYAYIWIEEDRSLGLHNPAFTVSLIKASIELLGGVTAVDYPTNTNMPEDYQLSQNYPNPFNPSTTINFSLPTNSKVKIVVYNITGQEVKVLVDGEYSAGNHETQFNTNSISGLASGIYFYQINAVSNSGGANFTQTKKMVLLK